MGRRDQDVHFLASKEEVQRIHEKMDELGIRSMGAYLRKMALDGYCINLDLQDLLRFSISVVAAWSIGWNWAGGLCGVVPVCPVPRNRRTYQRKPT